MINKLKNIANTEDKKRLISNFFSLSVLQGVNYLLPLLTLPYLVRVLGVEYFGLLAFATAMITYLNIITDYGFNLTATREISLHRDNKEKVIEIFSSVMSVKFILVIISFILLSILVLSFERFNKDWEIYFLTFGIVIGQALFPVWLFQGMEKMKYITYLNILSKLIFTVAIFIFVKEQNDYYIVPMLTSIGFIISGILSLILVKKEFKISFHLQKLKTIKYYFLDSWHVFQQQFYVSMYGPINIVFLGLLATDTVVGYYSIVEKILLIPLTVFAMAARAYYPYGVKLYEKNKKLYFSQFKKISFVYLISSILFIFIIFLFNKEIVSIITGKTIHNELVDILNILVFGILFSSFGGLYTYVFITLKKSKVLNKISFYIMWLNMFFSPLIINFFGVIGLSYFIVFRQAIVSGISYTFISKFKNRKI